jgi:NADPH:quinone reductase-like Zn-dependent oxidoreductase
VDASAAALAPGQVLVAVRAVGINFRDVLNVLGMYPGDPGPPGGDCAGVVVAAGPGSSLSVGQPVFGLAAGSLGSHVVASAKTVVPLPGLLSFEAAASMPTVFVTVDAALHRCAAMRPWDRVLVHAAAGGVGLAAMQVVEAAGAVPLATAGSSNKRALLRSLGVKQLASSRDTTFVDHFCQLEGQEPSVVLNSLTSSGMVAGSLAALSAGGRFVEISKRDIWSPARVAQGGWERNSLGFGCQKHSYKLCGGQAPAPRLDCRTMSCCLIMWFDCECSIRLNLRLPLPFSCLSFRPIEARLICNEPDCALFLENSIPFTCTSIGIFQQFCNSRLFFVLNL